MFSYDFPTWSVGVTLSYPIGRSFEEAGLARAEIERRQAAHRIASLEVRIAETVRQAARQVTSAAERVDALARVRLSPSSGCRLKRVVSKRVSRRASW